MPSSVVKHNLFLLLLVVAITLLTGLFLTPQNQQPKTVQNFTQQDLIKSDQALTASLRSYGPQKTLQTLSTLEAKGVLDCHQRAHQAGRIAAQIFPIEKAFREGSGECHSGYFHGTTEEYFAKYETANLSTNLKKLCTSSLNGFFRHQCYHGVGHGLMGWSNYEIGEALASCDLLEEQIDQSSCATGVFMENYTGAFEKEKNPDPTVGHISKYLSSDPQYPCNVVSDKYKGNCYFLQTSRMIQIFGVDFQKVADECKKAPQQYQSLCFASMGRDVGGSTNRVASESIKQCSHAPIGNAQTACLLGAVQDYFWDPSGASSAVNFCKLLNLPDQKSSCYSMIVQRAGEVLTNYGQKLTFCAEVEVQFQDQCRETTSI